MRILTISLVALCIVGVAQAEQTNIVFEAEDYTCIDAPLQVMGAPLFGCSEDKCIIYPQQWSRRIPVFRTEKLGRVHYHFSTPKADRWYIWLRVWTMDEGGDALRLDVTIRRHVINEWGNGAAVRTKSRMMVNDGKNGGWVWIKSPSSYGFLSGGNDIYLMGWEDGIKVDQVLITNDRMFTPTGKMKVKRGG